MNKTLIAMAAALLPMMAPAQTNTERLHISQMSVNKGDTLITLNMTLSPKEYRLKGTDIVNLTPMLASDGDTVEMPGVRIAGRKAWYDEVRNRRDKSGSLSRAGKGLPVEYSATIPFDSRFNTSSIVIKADTTNICRCWERSGLTPIADLDFNPFDPSDLVFRYEAPKDTAEKVFDLSGRANIIFKVNRTDIDWSYYSNHAELDTIVRTIKVVSDNPYATVERILLTGYASPEGPYDNNVRLAKGRTEVVTKYVEDHSSFPHSVYQTASVPEDWGGLRAWIADSQLPNKDEMIAFIDDGSIPIAKKNDMFMARFPKDYPYLLKNVYPVLRHTDYRITYKIKKFYDPDEIAQVFETNPRLLTLNELYILAGKYTPGSPEYQRVYSTAALMFPDSDVANLNAASAAMSLGDLQTAAQFLDKVKDGPQADYARGILAAKEGDYRKALDCLRKAQAAGVREADEVIAKVEKFLDSDRNVRIL